MRTTSTLAALLLASSSLLAVACDDGKDPVTPPTPDETKIAFEGLEDAQRQRLVIAGLGADAILAGFSIGFLPVFTQPGGCPTITADGDTLVLTGGCTADSEDGPTRYEGVAYVTNMGIEVDPSKPQSLEADDFTIDGPEGKQRFDGAVSYVDGVQDINLTAEMLGATVHTTMVLTCVNDVCTPDANASITFNDRTAKVSGSWNLNVEGGATPIGSIALDGADLLELDFANTVNGCTAYTIDGEDAGEFCDSDDDAE